MVYEITCNPEIQQKLYEEVLEMENKLNGGKLTYEKIQGMKYMDQVVCETLRHWPIGVVSCVKKYFISQIIP
jgi:cytochrome P450 family 9